MDPQQALAGLVALALVPPFLYLLWVRAHEKRRREPLRAVTALFLYGGTLGVGLALALNILFGIGFEERGALQASFLAIVVAAPVIEEFTKGLGLGFARRHLDEPEDGLIYGSAVGLGFAATENLVYTLSAYHDDGFATALWVVVARIFSSMLLHAGSSGLLGFGYGLVVRRGGFVAEALPFYLVAVVLHAAYNFLVLTQALLGFVFAVLLAGLVAGWVRRRIRALDALPHRAPSSRPLR